jgi:transcriptional regulator with XRE-family HTH domain
MYNGGMTASELRRLRRRLKLTQVALADLIGVPGNTIARWERNEMKMGPAMDKLVRLAVAQVEAPRHRVQPRRS